MIAIRIIRSTLLFLLCPLLTQAQQKKEVFHQALSIGVHGGVLASRFTFVPSVSQRIHIGNMAGLKIRYDVERGASLHLEANYLTSGWREKYDASGTS